MTSTANLVHHVPGRMRLRLHFAKGDPNRLLAIQESLRSIPGVREVTTNPTLGTLLIAYDPAVREDFTRALAIHAAQHELFEFPPAPPGEAEGPVSVTDRSLDRLAENINKGVQA